MPDVRRTVALAGVGLLAAAAVALSAAPSRTATTVGLIHASVLWVGDSYPAGAGSSTGAGYPRTVCARMRWQCTLDAQGGTGFVSDGHNNSLTFVPFLERLGADRVTVAPDLVVLDGGRNDERQPPQEVAGAVSRYITAVRRAFPNARMIFVVPTFLHPQTDNEKRIADVLRGLAGTYHASLVDPGALRWIRTEAQGRALMSDDRVHPSDAGHAYLADRFTDAFRHLDLR